jgi:hypothetical protein
VKLWEPYDSACDCTSKLEWPRIKLSWNISRSVYLAKVDFVLLSYSSKKLFQTIVAHESCCHSHSIHVPS